ncbi:hemagglutinin repeat-containing protein [Achromobacter xylosoxidans]
MTREAGSVLSGDRVSIVAGNDLTVTGSAIVGDRDVNLRAGRDVDISAATETESHYLLEKKKKSGLLDSGGIGFTLGNQSSRHEADEHGVIQSQSASTIGSTQGNVTITAENRVHVRGADLVAGTDLDITGDSVRIDPGYDERTRHETFESKQRGLTIALSGTVGSALNTAVSAARQAGQRATGGCGRCRAPRRRCPASRPRRRWSGTICRRKPPMQKHRGRLERRRQGCGAGGDQHDRRQHFLWQPVVQNRNAQRAGARRAAR